MITGMMQPQTIFDELMKIALEYYLSDIEKSRREVLGYIDSIKKTLTDDEEEYFVEKSRIFINDGFSVDEATAAALDLVIRKRPIPQGDRSRAKQNNLESLKAYTRRRAS